MNPKIGAGIYIAFLVIFFILSTTFYSLVATETDPKKSKTYSILSIVFTILFAIMCIILMVGLSRR